MLHFIRDKKLLQVSIQALKVQSFQNPLLKCHSQTNPPSSLAQYLQNSFGLSLEQALKSSTNINNKAPRNMDSVLSFLRSQGFSETDIKSIITKAPSILRCAAPSEWLLPKIELFREKGLSNSEVVDLIALNPTILTASLEKSIKPTIGFICSILGREELLNEFLKHRVVFSSDRLVANGTALKEYGVPNHHIAKFLTRHWRILTLNPDLFKDNVKMVKEMGFDPSTTKFLKAVDVKGCLSHLSWEMKFRVYKSCGWSDDQILSAFRREPFCFVTSEEKIRKAMDFFVKELCWGPPYISVYPVLLMLSLEMRIKPRHKFLKVLISKGLISMDKNVNSSSFIRSDKLFLEMYVMKYLAKFPDMFDVYEDITGLKGRA